jgi:hypothetical protein
LTSATTATNHITTITDLYGDSYDSYITVAATAAAGTAGAATVAVTGPTLASSTYTTSKIVFGTGNTAVTVDFTYQAPAAHTVAVANATNSVLSALAGTNVFVAKVTDQYTNALANVAVSVKVSGRNSVATKVLGVTDANGLISYSLTDAGTTGTTDTFTFTASTSSVTSALAYVNYGTVTVDSVTVSGGSKAETVAGSTLTTIKAGDNGPEGSAVAIKAVVKDASGNLLAGVPVTFTVDAGAIVKTAAVDYATVYTGSDGAASTSVFNWVSGKQTITATAGGKSSTDYLTWAANDATSARVLSATATGDIVSLKVVDRFGNGVQGVVINLSRTGAGLFGNGASTQDITTDKLGSADVRFVGTGTVVAELASTYAQAYATAGNITTKAATAAVAGTTKGTGASLTPAGVAKVSVVIADLADPIAASSQAAADAAAEATDAANAATAAALAASVAAFAASVASAAASAAACDEAAIGSARSAITTDTFATPAGASDAPVPFVVPATAAVTASASISPATSADCVYTAESSSATTVPEPTKRMSAVPSLSVVAVSVDLPEPNKPVPVRDRSIATPLTGLPKRSTTLSETMSPVAVAESTRADVASYATQLMIPVFATPPAVAVIVCVPGTQLNALVVADPSEPV